VSPALDLALHVPAGGSFGPSDWVRGRVTVLESEASRSLNVGVHFREKTSDYSAKVVSCGGDPVHVGNLVAGTSFEFAIQLPPDALPGYRSEHGELYWEVEARSDKPGRDTIVRRRLVATSHVPSRA
jgi:hypothetical protein